MAIQMIDHGTPEYLQMVDLRLQLLRKPLGLEFSTAELDKEKNDLLMGCFEDGRLEGCCMLTKDPQDAKAFKLRQMAVINGLQGKGLGKALIMYCEKIAANQGAKKIFMHARKTAVGFYEKLGYTIEGPEFLELNIPHYRMSKNLGWA